MIFANKWFFAFLPVVLFLYFALKSRAHKYNVLLVASWAFYAWLSPWYLWVILLCTIIDYCAAIRVEDSDGDRARKRWLVVSIAANLGLLIAFKYTPFVYDNAVTLGRWCGLEVRDRYWNILLPLGISFHTFQGISYTVDVYRKQIRAVRSFRDYALFVAFFPQLAAGPIVRAVEFLPQMETPPTPTADQIADGLRLFLVGLFKKLVIADQLDVLFVSPVFGNPSAFDPAAHRWAAVAWAAQIYCDFSGYSDMAIGIAKWFGFELPRNFDVPYLATNITDFWRRWHMSLSSWLRDYLYFPLGGSRRGPVRTYFNLMLLFVLCGLWHGATWAWLAYGVYNGLLICLHRAFDRAATGVRWLDAVRATRLWAVLAWGLTLSQLVAMLILVRMESWADGWLMLKSFAASDVWGAWSPRVPVWVPLLVVAVAVGHLFGKLKSRWGYVVPSPVRAAACVAALFAVVTLTPGVTKTFIYIQF
ncbi:MAG: MBOAT family protein [Planctomycetes bacterium]|nr:MBOAT family protein [Planctomycetota bacterium]